MNAKEEKPNEKANQTTKDRTKSTPVVVSRLKLSSASKGSPEVNRRSTQNGRIQSFYTPSSTKQNVKAPLNNAKNTVPTFLTRRFSKHKLVTYQQPQDLTKDIDIVLYGATGFIGQLACSYIANYPQTEFISELHLAIAGQSKEKLDTLHSRLKKANAFMERIIKLTADAFNTVELDRITSRSRCLLNFAGPYTWYGHLVIESCIRNVCHYVDLSGELPWVMKMMDKYGDKALQNKVTLINACGFSSVPSDLAILNMAKYVRETLKEQMLNKCLGIVVSKNGLPGFSSFENTMTIFQKENEKCYDEMVNDAQYFNPVDIRNQLDLPDPKSPMYIEDTKEWGAPSIAASVNSRVVRRSNALLNYGDNFCYTELILSPSWMKATISSSKSIIRRASVVLNLSDATKPTPENSFHLKYIGKTNPSSNRRVVCELKGTRDPENEMSARFMVEAGILLSKFQDQLPRKVQDGWGFLTPATALGEAYIERLTKHAGVNFTTELVEISE